MTRARSITGLSWPAWLVLALLLGYLTMSRSFSYVGIGPLYVGEIALGMLLVAHKGSLARQWLSSLIRGPALSGLAWSLYAFMGYGMVQCLRGISNYDTLHAVQCVVFHVYALFFFAGLWVGRRHPSFLPKAMPFLAWAHGLYGIAYIGLLSPLGLTDDSPGMDGDYVGWCGAPRGATVVLLGLLSFEPKLARVWLPLLLNVLVLLGMQVRAEWLGFAAGVGLWSVLTGRLLQCFKLIAVVPALLLVGLMLDVRLPSPATRGGEISAREIVGRAIAAVDRDAASEFTRDAEDYAETTTWRLGWWGAIWREVNSSASWLLFGFGYGYPIWDLHPEGIDPIRTPHNVFMFALGYTGLVGLALFCLFQLSIVWLLWRTYRTTGQPFGLCYWTLIVVWATFDNFLESPFGAIPFYLFIGLAAAPLITKFQRNPMPTAFSRDRSDLDVLIDPERDLKAEY